MLIPKQAFQELSLRKLKHIFDLVRIPIYIYIKNSMKPISQQAYTPIYCSFHDTLLAKATLRETCHIRYETEQQQAVETHSLIVDVYTHREGEFMELNTGEHIRLDRILAIEKVLLD